MKNLKLLFHDKIYFVSFLLLLTFVIMAFLWTLKKPEVSATGAPESPDTFIPDGFVLIPIDLQNAETFDGIVDRYALVDLFEMTDPAKKKQKKVAARVQMIRAPLNHERFAVLVDERSSATLLAAQGPLRAVVKNPNDQGKHEAGIIYTKGASD